MARRRATRLLVIGAIAFALYLVLFHESSPASFSSRKPKRYSEIKSPTIPPLLLTGGLQHKLDAQKYDFLQVRVGREEDEDWAVDDVMGHSVRDGIEDYWNRFQKPK
jgi:hypothetical protein